MKYLLLLSVFLVGCSDLTGKSASRDAEEDREAIVYGTCYCKNYEGLYLIEKRKYSRISNTYTIYCNRIIWKQTRWVTFYGGKDYNKSVIYGKKDDRCE